MNKFFEKRFTFLCNKSIVPILIWDCGCVCVWQCEKEKKEKVTIRSQSINQNQSLSFFVMVSSSGHFEERSMYQLFQLKERNFGGDKNIKTQTNRKKKLWFNQKRICFFCSIQQFELVCGFCIIFDWIFGRNISSLNVFPSKIIPWTSKIFEKYSPKKCETIRLYLFNEQIIRNELKEYVNN